MLAQLFASGHLHLGFINLSLQAAAGFFADAHTDGMHVVSMFFARRQGLPNSMLPQHSISHLLMQKEGIPSGIRHYSTCRMINGAQTCLHIYCLAFGFSLPYSSKIVSCAAMAEEAVRMFLEHRSLEGLEPALQKELTPAAIKQWRTKILHRIQALQATTA